MSSFRPDATSPIPSEASQFWLMSLLVSVFLLPNLRLPGGTPVRIDDLLVGIAGLALLSRATLRLRCEKPDFIALSLILLAISILVVTLYGPPTSELSVGPKEYLDVIRPLKFLVIYIMIRDFCRYDLSLRTMCSALPLGLAVLALIAFAQLLLVSPDSSGPLASFFLKFTELDEQHARSFFGLRPFATFHTPTDFGYMMAISMAAASTCFAAPKRKLTFVLSLVNLLISGTRTFLFGMPFIFGSLAILTGNSAAKRFRRLITVTGLTAIAVILTFTVLPKISPQFAVNTARTLSAISTGDYDADETIAIRLHNLQLAAYTWDNAKFVGVVSRDLLTVAADSEYILTFHRYGLIGIAELFLLYIAWFRVCQKLRSIDQPLANFGTLTLLLTALYGFTQGALINTRIGVLPIVILAIMSSRLRSESPCKLETFSSNRAVLVNA